MRFYRPKGICPTLALTSGMYPTIALAMETQAILLAEIEEYLRTHKVAETTFGKLAVNDGKFVSRLRTGANMTLATVDRVRGFLRSQDQKEVA